MTEKQRWLSRDLEAWYSKETQRIGRYSPNDKPKEPANVRAARKVLSRAKTVIKRWDASRLKPWKKQQDSLRAKRESVKRVILFGTTDEALHAINGLRKVKS